MMAAFLSLNRIRLPHACGALGLPVAAALLAALAAGCQPSGDRAGSPPPPSAAAASTQELTPWQHHITKENGTEPAFANEYWDNKADGIYVSIVTGKPLFSSLDKYDSGCGWPSFVKPISESEIRNLPDNSHGMIRTEVRTADDESHLGHVFNDGPPDRGGLRYCINSAAMRFIPKEKMQEAGFGHLIHLFEKKEPTEENSAP